MEVVHSSGPSPWQRVALTLALSLVPVVGSFVPIPGVSWDSLPGNDGRTIRTSLFDPGVGALLSGYLVVELVALLVPRLRRLRHAFPDGRARLRPWVYVTTLFFAAFQALGLSTVLRELTQDYGGGVSTPLIVVTAATGVLVLVARAIDGLGLVNGVIAVSLASECASAPRHFARAVLPDDPSAIAVAAALYVLPFVATWAAVRRFQQPMKDGAPSLGGPLSSLRPVLASGSLLAVPASLRAFHVPGADAWAAWIPGPHYDALLLGVGVTITLLLSWLLQLPERVARVLNVVERRDVPFTAADVQHSLRRGLLPTILLILTVLLAGELLQGRQLPDYAFPSALLTTLLMDGWHAFKLHAATPGLVCVWDERRPYAVPGLVAAARRAGISLRTSGTAQTGMLRLFGPYAAISLWTAPAEAEPARALLRDLLQQANGTLAVPPPHEATTRSEAAAAAKTSTITSIYSALQAARTS